MIWRNVKKKGVRQQMNVRKGDEVLVIAGNDKGKRGKVLKVFPAEGRIIVEGVRFIKRHSRPTPKLPQGGIVEREGKINVSNVMVIDPKSGNPTRIGHTHIDADSGKKKRVRVSKTSGEVLG